MFTSRTLALIEIEEIKGMLSNATPVVDGLLVRPRSDKVYEE